MRGQWKNGHERLRARHPVHFPASGPARPSRSSTRVSNPAGGAEAGSSRSSSSAVAISRRTSSPHARQWSRCASAFARSRPVRTPSASSVVTSANSAQPISSGSVTARTRPAAGSAVRDGAPGRCLAGQPASCDYHRAHTLTYGSPLARDWRGIAGRRGLGGHGDSVGLAGLVRQAEAKVPAVVDGLVQEPGDVVGPGPWASPPGRRLERGLAAAVGALFVRVSARPEEGSG
jgi:hypothetical protein